MSTEPLWGTAFASVVMGEVMGVNAGVGAIMILFSCVYSTLGWNGMTSLVTGKKEIHTNAEAIQALNQSTNMELEESMHITEEEQGFAPRRNYLPTKPLSKFSLKSGVAGALTSIVAAMASASSSPVVTMVTDELEEFL